MEFPAKSTPLVDWLDACLFPANRVDLMQIWSTNIPPGYKGPMRPKSLSAVLFVERGSMVVLAAGTTFVLRTGDVLWIPPGVDRCYMGQPDAGEPALCARYRFSVQTKSHELSPLEGPRLWRARMDLERPFAELRVLFEDRSELRGALVRAALVRLSAALLREHPQGSGVGLTQVQQERVLKLIDHSISTGVTVADLASAARLSQDWFGRMFKLTFAESPRQYLVNRRMTLAAELLMESPFTIKEICREIGINDQNLFSRQFKKRFGSTPTQYRKSQEPRPGLSQQPPANLLDLT